MTLQELFDFSLPSKPIDNNHLKLLLYLLEYPEKTASDAFNCEPSIFSDDKQVDYKTISRGLGKLHELGLVEKMPGFKRRDNDVKESIPYKLSLHGILCIILNYPSNIPYRKLVFYLSFNYPFNILFTEFLHDVITQEIILRPTDERLFAIVYVYLKSVCKELQKIAKSYNLLSCTPDGYILKKIFVWPYDSDKISSHNSIPFNDNALRKYLKNKFNWHWIEKSRIEPNYNQNLIDIYIPNAPEEIIRLFINKKENKAIINKDNKNIDELPIIKKNSFLSINIKTKEKKNDLLLSLLRDKCVWHKRVFRESIRRQEILMPRYPRNYKRWRIHNQNNIEENKH